MTTEQIKSEIRNILQQICSPYPTSENGKKFEAQMMLLGLSSRIIIPTKDEWVGVGLLERDDQLERK